MPRRPRPPLSRRRFARAAGLGAAGLGAAGLGVAGLACGSQPSPRAPAPATRAALFDAIRAAGTSELDDLVAHALEAGARPEAILGAALDARLRTRDDAEDIHSMAALTAVQDVHARASDPAERAAPLFFAVWSNHAWCRRDVAAARPPSDARGLETAVDAGDRVAADRAMAAKLVEEGPEACARWVSDVGSVPRGDLHAVIWTRHALALRDLAGPHEGLVFRSHAQFLANSPASGPPPRPLRPAPGDSTAPEEIARALRQSPDAPLDGLDPHALFGALAILCAEQRLRAPFVTGAPLHYTTALEAYWTLYEAAPAEQRAHVLARAVARLGPGAPDPTRVLTATEGPGDPFALAVGDIDAAYRAALRACARDEAAFVSAARSRVARYGNDEHDYKLFGALVTVAERLEDPVARARWLATAVAMNVMRLRDPSPRFQAAARAT